MNLQRLMWLCAALFVFFGLLLAIVEDHDWRKICGGISALSLSGFSFFMVGSGLSTGRIRIQNSWINLVTQPRAFWASIVLVTSAGIGVAIAAIWILFFKM